MAQDGRCMVRKASHKKDASGVLVYLVEELGDARLRAAQLKQYVVAAQELVEKSEHKDHIHEVAANLLHGIPDTLFKLDKALDAAAMAASRMDYEEIKQGLKPEKAEELERVLEDVRLQYLKRRSNPDTDQKDEPMQKPVKTAAARAKDTRTAILDYLLNSLEYAESPHEEVGGLVSMGLDEKVAKEIIAKWNKERPDMEGLGDVMRTQHLTEKLVDGVLRRHRVPAQITEKSAQDNQTAADALEEMAVQTDAEQSVPTEKLARLIAQLGGGKQDSQKDPAGYFREAAAYLRGTQTPDRQVIVASLRRVLADNLDVEAAKKPTSVPDKHQLKILLDTVRNPMKSMLGGPNANEAEEILREKFQYTDSDIKRLKHASDDFDVEAGVVQAAGWKELEDNKGHRWVMDGKGEVIDAAHIHEIQGPSIPLYILKFLLKDGKAIKAQKNFKSLKDAQKAAATWLKSDADGANLLFLDFTKVATDDVEAGAGEQFKKVNPNISDEAVEEINEMHEKHKDVVKEKHADDYGLLTTRTARLMSRQEAILKKYLASGGTAKFFDDLPFEVQSALQRVKDQETLWSDVDRWLSDNTRQKMTMWASDDYGVDVTAFDVQAGKIKPVNQQRLALWAQHAKMVVDYADYPPQFFKFLSNNLEMLHNRVKETGAMSVAKGLKSAEEAALKLAEMADDEFVKTASDDYGLDVTARYEKGKPADPTENMSEEDAAEWEAMNEKHKDKFKAASDGSLFDQIQPRSTVTILTPQGHKVKGKAVMRGPHGWVLNLGGPHGRPGIATPENVVMVKAASDVEAAGGLPEFFNMTANPIPQLGRVKGFDPVSDNKLQTKDRRFSLVPTNTLSRGALSQILSIGPNDTVALLDVHGKALDCASPKDTKFKLKNMDRWPWTEVRASAAGTWDPSAKYAADDYGLTAEDDKAARFEKGKPADPTENMSEEDAAEWEAMNEKHKDKFKSAANEDELDFNLASKRLAVAQKASRAVPVSDAERLRSEAMKLDTDLSDKFHAAEKASSRSGHYQAPDAADVAHLKKLYAEVSSNLKALSRIALRKGDVHRDLVEKASDFPHYRTDPDSLSMAAGLAHVIATVAHYAAAKARRAAEMVHYYSRWVEFYKENAKSPTYQQQRAFMPKTAATGSLADDYGLSK